MLMRIRKLRSRYLMWKRLSGMLTAFALLGLFVYLRKRQQQPRPQRAMEIPVEVETDHTAHVQEQTAAAEPEAKTPASAPTTAPEPDDLQRIEGVGPKISRVLNAAGITTFQQIAERDAEEIRQILAAAEVRANTSTWPEQAQLAASGDWERLAQLQSKIKSGRRIS
jgi:predicted flap endonuclease-1-like 5' DNA nuclease